MQVRRCTDAVSTGRVRCAGLLPPGAARARYCGVPGDSTQVPTGGLPAGADAGKQRGEAWVGGAEGGLCAGGFRVVRTLLAMATVVGLATAGKVYGGRSSQPRTGWRRAFTVYKRHLISGAVSLCKSGCFPQEERPPSRALVTTVCLCSRPGCARGPLAGRQSGCHRAQRHGTALGHSRVGGGGADARCGGAPLPPARGADEAAAGAPNVTMRRAVMARPAADALGRRGGLARREGGTCRGFSRGHAAPCEAVAVRVRPPRCVAGC